MKILIVFVLLFSFICNSFAAPLIYKTTKDIKGEALQELATVDIKNFKSIRIAVSGSADENIGANSASGRKFRIAIFGIEDGKELFLQGQYENFIQYNTVIQTPPEKIKIKVIGESAYSLYVWGE